MTTATKNRKPVAIKSTDSRKAAIVVALKSKYSCRKVTSVKHDRDSGRFVATVMHFNGPTPQGEQRDGECFVLEADVAGLGQ